MGRMKVLRYILFPAVAAVCLGLLMFMPLTSRRAIDGETAIIKIPLYTKVGGFLYRDHEYRRISCEITKGISTEEEKALAAYR